MIHSDSDFATVAYLRVKETRLEGKELEEAPTLFVPPLLDEKYLSQLDVDFEDVPDVETLSPSSSPSNNTFPIRSRQVGNWVAVSNVQRTSGSDLSTSISVEEEVKECFQLLSGTLMPLSSSFPLKPSSPVHFSDELKNYNLELHHCANINIFLSSIDSFVDVNSIYSTFFGTSPPARACVAVALPSGIRVRLDVIAFVEQNRGERQAHHVQGLSYWAPANIGPYSQAILAQEAVFVSGQIGLIPSNLTLANSLQVQTALACQHADRIVGALASNAGSNWSGIPLLNIWWFGKASDLMAVKSYGLVEARIILTMSCFSG